MTTFFCLEVTLHTLSFAMVSELRVQIYVALRKAHTQYHYNIESCLCFRMSLQIKILYRLKYPLNNEVS